MSRAACTKCLDNRPHPWHDNGEVNLAYAYEDEGIAPPRQTSSDAMDDLILAGERAVMSGPNRNSYSAWSQEEMEIFARGLVDNPEVHEDPDQNPKELAYQSIELVYGDRQGSYGHPYDDYSRTAGMWSAFLGVEITPAQAALMMVLLKVSRERNRPKDDNIVDAHGYLLCYGRIQGRDQAA